MKKQSHIQKHASRRSPVSRGRLYLQAKLPWLAGFPIDQTDQTVTWMVVPRTGAIEPHEVTIGRHELHEATFASTRLVHRFPRSFPNIVDDPAAWKENLPLLLDLLKDAIHQGQALPASLHTHTVFYPYKLLLRFEAALESKPSLRPLLGALSWVCVVTPKELRIAIDWAVNHYDVLEPILTHHEGVDGVATCLVLWQMTRQDSSKRMVPLFDWLAHPQLFTLVTGDVGLTLATWQERLMSDGTGKRAVQTWENRIDVPEPLLYQALHRFVLWLGQSDRNTRRRALELFGLVGNLDMLAPWEAWWQQATRALSDAVQIDHERLFYRRTPEKTEKIAQFVMHLGRLRERIPHRPRLSRIIELVKYLSGQELIHVHTAACELLTYSPIFYNDFPVRPPLLDMIVQYQGRYQEPHVIRFCQDWAAHRRKNVKDTSELHILNSFFDRWHKKGNFRYWGIFVRFMTEAYPLRFLPDCLAAWQACLNIIPEKVLEDFDEDVIVSLQKVTQDVALTAVYYQALIYAGLQQEYFDEPHFRVAHALSDNDPTAFALFAKRMLALSDQNQRHFETVGNLLVLLVKRSWFRLAHDILGRDLLPRFVQVASLRSALRKMHEKTPFPEHPIPTAVPDWCDRYPRELHPVLSALDELDETAEKTAERLLGEQFPNPNILQREIGALSKRLSGATGKKLMGMQRRIENLNQRLTAPRNVSPQKLANLEEKLVQSLHRAILDNWHDALLVQLRQKMREVFKLEEVPEWFLEPKQLQIIAPMLELKPGFRHLGIRLFQERCGPRPWGLFHEPQNQAFVRRMVKLGLNMEPWCTPNPPKAYRSPIGREVTIRLCDDPLEVFHMGAHFRTCLAPGVFNFFAVFSNAADVNKQVVYGYNEKGQVVGRCLLALTNEGGIITFEAYTHDPKLEFEEMVRQWVTDLAEQMNTRVLPDGKVSNLVATDWYDDGPRDIAQQFLFLEYSSDFRYELSRIPLDQLVPRLEKEFMPQPLNAFTLPLILNLFEFQQRPELVIPLIPYIETCKNLPIHVLIRTATLAFRAGAIPFARQILRDLSLAPILEAYRLYEWLDHDTMLGLAGLAPSTTLKVLRRTRPDKVRRDEQETHPHRVEQYAVAYEALGRPNRARVMRERLAELQE